MARHLEQLLSSANLAAAESVLTQAGFKVHSPKGHICCGRALYDFGLLGAARAYLAKVFDRMAPEIEAGLPFIFLEPSCASVFKDEALELFPSGPLATRAQRMSQQVWLLADWLAAKAPEWVTGRLGGRADDPPWPLPPQSRLRRPGKRDRLAEKSRRDSGAYQLQLLRHGRTIWF